MPDPHVLYVVTAVVVLALVAWVIVVVTRAPPLQGPPKAEKAPLDKPAPETTASTTEGAEGAEKASDPASPRASRTPLDAHMEIQDEKPGGKKTGEG